MVGDKTIKRPLLISHRGAHKEAPENSCQAFEIALDHGVDGIETDVQLSCDGVPVLFHNPTACNVTGSRKRISSYTCEQLQDIDLIGVIANRKVQRISPTFLTSSFQPLSLASVIDQQPANDVGSRGDYGRAIFWRDVALVQQPQVGIVD